MAKKNKFTSDEEIQKYIHECFDNEKKNTKDNIFHTDYVDEFEKFSNEYENDNSDSSDFYVRE